MPKNSKAKLTIKKAKQVKKLSTSKKNFLGQYVHQREDFFGKHKSSRILIGVFIVAFAVYLGVLIRNARAQVAVSNVLIQEGIDPLPALQK